MNFLLRDLIMDSPADCQLDIIDQTRAATDDSTRYRLAAQWIAQRFGLSSLHASIAIVDDPTIQRLNQQHLQHDWPTDVISFVFETDEAVASVDGEVVASIDTARRMADLAGWSVADELLLYVIHGLLHLAGLDDATVEDQREMRRAEQACLMSLGVQGGAEHVRRWSTIS